MSIQAIETQYNGYRFRSRLEARWAVFFDALGLRYEYEPQGYHTAIGGYLPDFYLKDKGFYVEIKPDRQLTETELVKALYLASSESVFVLCGSPGIPVLRDNQVIDGPYALSISNAIDPKDDKPWDEERVLSMTIHTLGMIYPKGSYVPFGYNEVLDKSGNVIGSIFSETEYNGDLWRIYRCPLIQADGFLMTETWAVHHKSGTVVHIESRPWLWHQWPDGDINMWCYPEYVPKSKSAKGIAKLVKTMKEGKPGWWRPQQSVAKVKTPQLEAAYTAARSARFEFGETPKVPRGKLRK